MSDMTKLDDEVRVIAEFGDVSDGTSYVEHGMAREIMRQRRILAALRADRESLSSQLQNCTYDRDGWKRRAERFERILAALREPSDGVFEAAYGGESKPGFFWGYDNPIDCIRAAVAAAEQEVGRE